MEADLNSEQNTGRGEMNINIILCLKNSHNGHHGETMERKFHSRPCLMCASAGAYDSPLRISACVITAASKTEHI